MNTILSAELIRATVRDLFDANETEIIERPASYIIKLKHEVGNKISRIILLPPMGFSANKINELAPHPEVRKAKITIKGGVRPNKKGFNILKGQIKFVYYTKRNIPVEENYPYATANTANPFYKENIKSSREKFFVVKENGEGFYHNLINISDEWILMILEKELRLQKILDINSKIKNLEKNKQKSIVDLIEAIRNAGDKIFDKNKKSIDKILTLDTGDVIPALIEALNIYETGQHEPCTVYALILKFAKKQPDTVLEFLKNALTNNEAPKYYLEELIKKTPKLQK